MQTKKASVEELKKSICKNYLKGGCSFGKECRYRHPSKTDIEPDVTVCRYFLEGKCKRGLECPFAHVKPKSEKKKLRSDWQTFCLYYPTGQCINRDCRFLHVSNEDMERFNRTGKVSTSLCEQAMCKALVQDGGANANQPVCKDYMQGHCKWLSCPLLHLSRYEFSQEVLAVLHQKFCNELGIKDYSSYNAGYQQDLPMYKTQLGHDSYMPLRKEPLLDESYLSGYGNTKFGNDPSREYGNYGNNKQKYVDNETERIINGVYNLMRGDERNMRSTQNKEVADLRDKLSRLAEENSRYRYEFSHGQHMEDNRFNYSSGGGSREDAIRKLEKENMEMKQRLAMMQEQESYYTGKPAPLLGRYPSEQTYRGGAPRGQKYYANGYDDGMGWYDYDYYGYSQSYNSKQKVKSQLRQNMAHQYSKPRYARVINNYEKYTKPQLASKKKAAATTQKSPQKGSTKVTPKKKPESEDNEEESPKQKEEKTDSNEKEENEKSEAAESSTDDVVVEDETNEDTKDDASSADEGQYQSLEEEENKESETKVKSEETKVKSEETKVKSEETKVKSEETEETEKKDDSEK